jgi:hypothetical protein
MAENEKMWCTSVTLWAWRRDDENCSSVDRGFHSYSQQKCSRTFHRQLDSLSLEIVSRIVHATPSMQQSSISGFNSTSWLL